jgi:hypothetical protein
MVGDMLKEEGVPLAFLYSIFPKTPQQGAATSLYAALSPDVAAGGKYALYLPLLPLLLLPPPPHHSVKLMLFSDFVMTAK